MDEIRSVFIVKVRSLWGLLIAHVVGIVREICGIGVPFARRAATALMLNFLMVRTCITDRSMFWLRWIPKKLLRRLVLDCLAMIALVGSSRYLMGGGLFLVRLLSLRNWTDKFFTLCLSIKAIFELVSWVSRIWRQQVYTFVPAAWVVRPNLVLFTRESLSSNVGIA